MSITFGGVGAAGQLGWGRFSKMSRRHLVHPPFSDRSLSAPPFTKPALTLKKVLIEDMRSCGLIQGDSAFAQNSPGEYSILAALAKAMPVVRLAVMV